jgi:hypothetical protein
MKKSALYICLLVFIFLYSCNQNPNPSASNAKTECYTSVSGRDSASLTLKYQYGRIDGSLNLYFADKDDLSGNITGNFKGDTLVLAYTYKSGNKPEYFQNPLVFLKKDTKLYQGYGEIISSYGRSHFKEGAPIDFTRGFVFSPGNCE